MPAEKVSRDRHRVSEHPTIPRAERPRNSEPKEVLRSPVNRKLLHPHKRESSYKISIARDEFLSSVIRKAPHPPKKNRGSVPEAVVTSSVKHLARSPAQLAQESRISKTHQLLKSTVKAPRPLARLSKRRVYNELNTEPIYLAYAQCVCDLKDDSNGENKLRRAERTGKALYVLDNDGTHVVSCAHLRNCVRFVPEYPVSYDPATVASDVLRAIGSHPREPALNQYWNLKLATELQAITNLKGG